MSFFGKPLAVAFGAVALSGAALAPLGLALSAGSAEAHQLSDAAIVASTPTAIPAVPQPAEAPLPGQPAVIDPADVREGDEIVTPDTPARPAPSQIVDAELTCLAKVVLHESGNQPRAGQLAVAQVVMNRLNDPRGRFGRTICGVVMQRGQFFNVHAYNPRRDSRWHTAVSVAREARHGESDQVMNGALFFHSASANMTFRGRQRIGRLAGHVFYR